MSYQSSSPMPRVSQPENGGGFALRPGQQSLHDYLVDNPGKRVVPVKWPGGYGKTIGMALAYKIKKDAGICDRLLIVVANDTQRDQIVNDFAADCARIGLLIDGGVSVYSNEPQTVKNCKAGTMSVFVINIQSVSSTNRSEIDCLLTLILDGGFKWMLACDEYHHYGNGMDWGNSLQRIVEKAKFVIAMSATPTRDRSDTIFGKPVDALCVSYRDAVVNQKCLKELRAESYKYSVDIYDHKTGEIKTLSTEEIKSLPDGTEKSNTKTQLRYLNNYISPIIRKPASRLISLREQTERKLQMLVRTVKCGHAECICKQLEAIFKEDEYSGKLTVDWIGTGKHGKTPEENKKIKEAFCPPKEENGVRPEPTLDVLVQVDMAGEGFDSINVVEIVDFSTATLNGASNQSKQFYKRGARWIPGLDEEYQICYVNVPEDHPLSNKKEHLVDWIDGDQSLDDFPESNTENSNWMERIKPMSMEFFEPQASITVIDADCTGTISDGEIARYIEKLKNGIVLNGVFGDTHLDFDFTNKEHKGALIEVVRNLMFGTNNPKASADFVKNMTAQQRLDAMRKQITIGVNRVSKFIRETFYPNIDDKNLLGEINARVNAFLKSKHGQRDSLVEDELRLVAKSLCEIERNVRSGRFMPWLA